LSRGIDVSVVMPTHDGAGLIPRALAQIAAQKTSSDLAWEVIVVDNASSDGTADVARAAWPVDAPVPLRVVREPKLGLANAHLRGFAEAEGEVVTCVEDDNLVAPDWVEVARRTMAEHPAVGACGGFNEAVCEDRMPWWFTARQGYYACGPQGNPGDVTDERGFLWGAGMTVRAGAWRDLVENGWRPQLTDRRGRANHDAGGDSEICFALRLRGWRLRFEPALYMRHALQEHRLEWGYLRRLLRGLGSAGPGLDSYRRALGDPAVADRSSHWNVEVRRLFTRLREQRRLIRKMRRDPCEGDDDVLALEQAIGRFRALLRQRGRYDRSFPAMESASWRRESPGSSA
jgi:glycosyltransferase involved in cell wall biosynthesis